MPHSDPTLAALEKLLEPLNKKLDALSLKTATKEDLVQLRTDFEEKLETRVQSEVQPLREELTQLTTEVRALQTAGPHGNRKQPVRHDLTDPAHRRVAFLGFPAEMPPEERLKKLSEYLEQFPTLTPLAVCNRYKGPRKNRTCTANAYAEFSDQDVRDLFLKAAEDKPLKVNSKVTV